MTINIANEYLSAQISTQGAELHSLCAIATNEQFIWQADPKVWSGRAPILFPIVGALLDNTLRIDGNQYSLPKHGLARQSIFTTIATTNDSATLCLQSSEQTLASYPWHFQLTVDFSLKQNKLRIGYQVMNQDDCEMIFTIGSHPAFALPKPLTEYYLEFETAESLGRYYLREDGLLDSQSAPWLDQQTKIELTGHLFDDDALIFKNIASNAIHLNHQSTGRRLTVNTGGAPHLGLWAKPGAAFVCIEPWYGYNDSRGQDTDFRQKPSMQTLAAGECSNSHIEIDLNI